jgi:small subunit ribosomal protein S8
MTLTDPIADMLTRIRNALLAKHANVEIPHSKLKERILEIFREEGYIDSISISTESGHKRLAVKLKYTDNGSSVIRGLKRVSKPGGRVYVNSSSMIPVLGGLGNGIVSTSRGVKTVKQCLNEKVGGEYICQIW